MSPYITCARGDATKYGYKLDRVTTVRRELRLAHKLCSEDVRLFTLMLPNDKAQARLILSLSRDGARSIKPYKVKGCHRGYWMVEPHPRVDAWMVVGWSATVAGVTNERRLTTDTKVLGFYYIGEQVLGTDFPTPEATADMWGTDEPN